ncbi:FAD-binding oxidoreductase [Halococcus sp. AFM35]|uniref:globin domain-containing protein n=1 Tax=Halococcus sp. AFM35 TaxID=3421653 RepID=UPI003EB84A6C
MAIETTVSSIKQLTPDVKEFTLEADDHVFDYEPGQHARIRYEEDVDGKGQERPYTATNLPGTDHLTLAIKHYENGAASTYMHERTEGDGVRIEEPAGGLTLDDPDRDVVFVSTGVGITPMLAMLRQYLRDGTGEAYFFFGEQDRDHLIYRETLDRLDSEHENMHLVYSVTDPDEDWSGPTGNVQEYLDEYLDTFDRKDFYVCGVPQMVVDTKQLLIGKNISTDHIFSEGWEEGVLQPKADRLSVYEGLGGMEAVRSVVSRMYDHIFQDERLAPYFEGTDMDSLVTNQSRFIAMLLGGPEYHHHIPETHAHMELRDEHYDAVLAHLRTSLKEHDISNQNISRLMAQLEQYRPSTVTA